MSKKEKDIAILLYHLWKEEGDWDRAKNKELWFRNARELIRIIENDSFDELLKQERKAAIGEVVETLRKIGWERAADDIELYLGKLIKKMGGE